MKNAIMIFIGLVAGCIVTRAELPKDSKELQAKLVTYETERRALAEQEIATKRSKVIELLLEHQRRETQAGNLENAISIRGLVEVLSSQQASIAGPEAVGSGKAQMDEKTEVGEEANAQTLADTEDFTAIISSDRKFLKWLENVEFQIIDTKKTKWIEDEILHHRNKEGNVVKRSNLDLNLKSPKIVWSEKSTGISYTIEATSLTTAVIFTDKEPHRRKVVVRVRE